MDGEAIKTKPQQKVWFILPAFSCRYYIKWPRCSPEEKEALLTKTRQTDEPKETKVYIRSVPNEWS